MKIDDLMLNVNNVQPIVQTDYVSETKMSYSWNGCISQLRVVADKAALYKFFKTSNYNNEQTEFILWAKHYVYNLEYNKMSLLSWNAIMNQLMLRKYG